MAICYPFPLLNASVHSGYSVPVSSLGLESEEINLFFNSQVFGSRGWVPACRATSNEPQPRKLYLIWTWFRRWGPGLWPNAAMNEAPWGGGGRECPLLVARMWFVVNYGRVFLKTVATFLPKPHSLWNVTLSFIPRRGTAYFPSFWIWSSGLLGLIVCGGSDTVQASTKGLSQYCVEQR